MKRKREVLLLIPSFLGFFIFFIIPFLYSFYYAFTRSAFDMTWAGFDNFKILFGSEYFRLALKNTIAFTIISVPLIMVLSVVISLLIVQFLFQTPLVKNAFFLPVLLPSATIVMVWQAYFSNITPFASLLVMFLWKYMGLNIMLILTALAGVDKNMLEAARIDGAGLLRLTWSVTLPNISPLLFFTFILSMVNSLKIYRESYLLWGTHPDTKVYMLQNYLNNHFAKLNYQNISTAAILFFVVIYLIVAIVFRLEKKASEQIW
ncbi:MAG: sugar transporter permease [Herbinix sp.]|jgi:multiple sugar transport system permease protein|nr:sugar transporter permease [Herbinix sp.]